MPLHQPPPARVLGRGPGGRPGVRLAAHDPSRRRARADGDRPARHGRAYGVHGGSPLPRRRRGIPDPAYDGAAALRRQRRFPRHDRRQRRHHRAARERKGVERERGAVPPHRQQRARADVGEPPRRQARVRQPGLPGLPRASLRRLPRLRLAQGAASRGSRPHSRRAGRGRELAQAVRARSALPARRWKLALAQVGIAAALGHRRAAHRLHRRRARHHGRQAGRDRAARTQ